MSEMNRSSDSLACCILFPCMEPLLSRTRASESASRLPCAPAILISLIATGCPFSCSDRMRLSRPGTGLLFLSMIET